METTLIPIGKPERKLVKIAAAERDMPIYEFLSALVNAALAPAACKRTAPPRRRAAARKTATTSATTAEQGDLL